VSDEQFAKLVAKLQRIVELYTGDGGISKNHARRELQGSELTTVHDALWEKVFAAANLKSYERGGSTLYTYRREVQKIPVVPIPYHSLI
jgi:hypothetical protein